MHCHDPVFKWNRAALEGKRLRAVWGDLEEKCFNKYISEINDDHKGFHVYEVLKSELTGCRQLFVHDNRREVLQTCHNKILTLSRRCMSTNE